MRTILFQMATLSLIVPVDDIINITCEYNVEQKHYSLKIYSEKQKHIFKFQAEEDELAYFNKFVPHIHPINVFLTSAQANYVVDLTDFTLIAHSQKLIYPE